MYKVYVLKSIADGNFYYGFTNNLSRRLKEHNLGKIKTTKYRRPLEVMYYENVATLELARKREKYFKSGFGRKYIKNKIINN